MKEFNAENALRIFRDNKKALFIAQRHDGLYCFFDKKPTIINNEWENGFCPGFIDYYLEHPDGWQNSLYSRDQFVCYKCDGYGEMRANYTNDQGKYVFHKIPCYNCQDENGVPTGLAMPEGGGNMKLKPCPFCGSKAMLEYCDPGCCNNVRIVSCTNNQCCAEIYVDCSKKKAIEKWNTRPKGE